MPQLVTQVGVMRITSRLMNGTGGSTSSSATAVPRISSPRTVHGSRETRSSITGGTHGTAADEDVAGLLVEERADRVVLGRALGVDGGETGQGLALQVRTLG